MVYSLKTYSYFSQTHLLFCFRRQLFIKCPANLFVWIYLVIAGVLAGFKGVLTTSLAGQAGRPAKTSLNQLMGSYGLRHFFLCGFWNYNFQGSIYWHFMENLHLCSTEERKSQTHLGGVTYMFGWSIPLRPVTPNVKWKMRKLNGRWMVFSHQSGMNMHQVEGSTTFLLVQ